MASPMRQATTMTLPKSIPQRAILTSAASSMRQATTMTLPKPIPHRATLTSAASPIGSTKIINSQETTAVKNPTNVVNPTSVTAANPLQRPTIGEKIIEKVKTNVINAKNTVKDSMVEKKMMRDLAQRDAQLQARLKSDIIDRKKRTHDVANATKVEAQQKDAQLQTRLQAEIKVSEAKISAAKYAKPPTAADSTTAAQTKEKTMAEKIKVNINTVKNYNNPAYKGLNLSEKKRLETLHAKPLKTWGATYRSEKDKLLSQKEQYKQELKQPNLSSTEKLDLKNKYENTKQEAKSYDQTMRERFADQMKGNKANKTLKQAESELKSAEVKEFHGKYRREEIKARDFPEEPLRRSVQPL